MLSLFGSLLFSRSGFLLPGVAKIADHGTNGPRNFSRSPERIKGEKKRDNFREVEKMESQFFVKIVKAVLIDSRY